MDQNNLKMYTLNNHNSDSRTNDKQQSLIDSQSDLVIVVCVRVHVHCCLDLYGLSKELVQYVSVASALTGTHRHCLIVASLGQEPEIQSLVSQGQIVSTDLP